MTHPDMPELKAVTEPGSMTEHLPNLLLQQKDALKLVAKLSNKLHAVQAFPTELQAEVDALFLAADQLTESLLTRAKQEKPDDYAKATDKAWADPLSS